MIQTEQEKLVQHYLSGTMSQAAEQDFYIQLALDGNLRNTLKAHQSMEASIRNSRESASAVHLRSRTRFMENLRAAAPVTANGRIPESRRETRRPAAWLLGSFGSAGSAAQMALGSVALAALLAGAFAVGTWIGNGSPSTPIPARNEVGVAMPQSRASHRLMPEVSYPSKIRHSQPEGASSAAVTGGPSTSSDPGNSATALPHSPARHSVSLNEAKAAPSHIADKANDRRTTETVAPSVTEKTKALPSQHALRPLAPRVVTNDTIRFHVKIGDLPNR